MASFFFPCIALNLGHKLFMEVKLLGYADFMPFIVLWEVLLVKEATVFWNSGLLSFIKYIEKFQAAMSNVVLIWSSVTICCQSFD